MRSIFKPGAAASPSSPSLSPAGAKAPLAVPTAPLGVDTIPAPPTPQSAQRGYLPAPAGGAVPSRLADAASVGWVRRIVDVVNSLLQGKMNAVTAITLTAGSGGTAIADPRISASSGLYLSPLTANAAAELPTLYFVSQTSGQAVVAHTSNAQTDRVYQLLIIG